MHRSAFVLTLVLFAAPPASAWGVLGHRMVAAGAVKDLPPGVEAWYAGHEETLTEFSTHPDGWKAADPLEGPRHFLDCEPYGSAAQVPLDEDTAMALLGPGLFQKTGQVPWVILERVQCLTLAFAAGLPHQVAWETAVLSHYVGDLNVPLHTTLNYNGEATGQEGVHKRWEGELLERIVAAEGWVPAVRRVEAADRKAPWQWIQESFIRMPGVLADDARAQGPHPQGRYGEAYWSTFTLLQGPCVKEQLDLAAQRTAQMILLAWTRAGQPQAILKPEP